MPHTQTHTQTGAQGLKTPPHATNHTYTVQYALCNVYTKCVYNVQYALCAMYGCCMQTFSICRIHFPPRAGQGWAGKVGMKCETCQLSSGQTGCQYYFVSNLVCVHTVRVCVCNCPDDLKTGHPKYFVYFATKECHS